MAQVNQMALVTEPLFYAQHAIGNVTPTQGATAEVFWTRHDAMRQTQNWNDQQAMALDMAFLHEAPRLSLPVAAAPEHATRANAPELPSLAECFSMHTV